MLKLDYQSSYVHEQKRQKKKNGQLANSDNRRDFERQNHLTCLLISCLSQLIIQVTLMTSLLCIHCFQRNKRKKRATLIRILRNPSVFSKDRHALEDQLIISFFFLLARRITEIKKNADELFEARINLIMNLYSVSDIRNACASALSNIDQIRSMKIGENLLLKMHHRLSFLSSP
jgi:hypothetical protein